MLYSNNLGIGMNLIVVPLIIVLTFLLPRSLNAHLNEPHDPEICYEDGSESDKRMCPG